MTSGRSSPRLARLGRPALGLAAVLAAALVAEVTAAALSQAFTLTADLVVAVSLLTMVSVVAVQVLFRPVGRSLARRRSDKPDAHPRSSWVPWTALLVAIVAWELVCFALSPRSAHPTLSSMLDTLTASHVGRGLTFFAWLVLGWYLVTR
jgi:amino acid permease